MHGNTGKHHTEEARLKISKNNARYWLGKKLSKETRKKIGLNGVGLHAGEKSGMWKGDKVGYRALHNWVERLLGKPKECKKCGQEKNRMHWANISGEYKRDLTDWLRLCPRCHKHLDMGLISINQN